jgi:hypothetical protein
MAVSDHLKTAATEIMKAAELIKQDIESLRKDHTNLQRDREIQIAQRTDNVRQLERQQKTADDTGAGSQLQAQVQGLLQQITDLRHEIAESERNIDNAVREKTGLLQSLEQQARSVMP